MNPDRGSFPKAPHPETPAEKRARYEAWVCGTHRERMVDPEYDAVMAQPGRSDFMHPNLKLAIRARCWQCSAGDDDAGGVDRIRTCQVVKCPIWSVRPYQPEGAPAPAPAIAVSEVRRGDFAAAAVAKPGSRRRAITGYCFQCSGGVRQTNTMAAVQNCASSHCALWTVRPQLPDTTPPVLNTL